eukprot:Anaeramoba_ignava/a478851_33.p1 GENE.a478851_33~~a478851_33.p1  ORF type:complete len:802 (+),score=77.86 a478851_33:282-2687(+)
MYEDMELEFLQVFVGESRELIEEVEPQLIEILQESDRTGEIDVTSINAIFRLFHSMKGSAASLGLNNIASLTHKAETLLDLFREGKADFEAQHVDLLLRTLDLTSVFLELVETNHNDKGHEDEKEALIEELTVEIEKTTGPKPKKGSKTKKAKKTKETKKKTSTAEEIKLDDEEPVSTPKEEETSPKKPAGPDDFSPVSLLDESMIKQFVTEATEFLDNAERILLELEEETDDTSDSMRELFRGFHSFKGNCGFLGLQALESLSHKAETVFETLFDKGITPAPEQVMTFLIIVDSLRQGVETLPQGGSGEVEGQNEVIELLEQMTDNLQPPADEPPKIGQILVEDGTVTQDQLHEALEKQKTALGDVLVDMGATSPEKVKEALKKQTEKSAKVSSISKSIKRSEIRVDLGKLDQLVNLVGELVIAETMVTKNSDLKDLVLENFEKAVHHLRRVTSELQDVAMSVRMIPLTMTFQKLVRVVHDLARKSEKRVKLKLVGEETEVDKTMTEQIADPLLHMVRNSVDHGIESPEERLALGKPEQGEVTIEARYEGGEVWIVVSDDGKGLDPEKILKKAIEKGVVQGDGSNLSEEEIFNLIFAPGFSTNDVVSEVSGRGVGMDVVKKNIEKLKGRIAVRSKLGQGTSIYLQIPLTLAIIDGMLVRVGDSRYTIPLLAIRESIQPSANSITLTPDGGEIVRIREELIPVIRLHQLHNKKSQFTELAEGILVIVEDRNKKAAIFIDEILGQQQTVIKGLSSFLSDAKGFSGCTILGDGAVSLILDISALVDNAGNKLKAAAEKETENG